HPRVSSSDRNREQSTYRRAQRLNPSIRSATYKFPVHSQDEYSFLDRATAPATLLLPCHRLIDHHRRLSLPGPLEAECGKRRPQHFPSHSCMERPLTRKAFPAKRAAASFVQPLPASCKVCLEMAGARKNDLENPIATVSISARGRLGASQALQSRQASTDFEYPR